MSVKSIQEAADAAEERTREMAARVVAASEAAPADEIAIVRAETAAVMLENATLRASVMSREEADRQIATAADAVAEIEGQADDGLISRDEALARLDRLQATGLALWMAQHHRDVWEQAEADMRVLLPGEG